MSQRILDLDMPLMARAQHGTDGVHGSDDCAMDFSLPVRVGYALAHLMFLLWPKQLPADRFDYNEAISRSSKQQMLTNIVRIRDLDFPVFMSVSSVITSYDYAGGIGIEGTAGLIEGDSVTGGANFAYAERPTITYAPLSGREFTERLLTPLPVEAIFTLGQAGWDIEMLLLTGINRINNVGIYRLKWCRLPTMLKERRDSGKTSRT